LAAAGTVKQGPTSQFELLREYCSASLPDITHVPGTAGVVDTEMLVPAAGRAAAVTLYLTHTSPVVANARKSGAGAGMFISVPAAEVINEMLVPVGDTSPPTARVAVFGRRHHPERVFEERAIDLLPQRENALYLGRMTNSPPIDVAPRHQEVVRHVLEKLGLQGQQFDVYRCRVQFPQMHTLVVMRVDGVNTH
jgi:hypothetical protein